MAHRLKCDELKKNRYRHEQPSTSHRFFKVMMGNFEHEMPIPKKFVETLRNKIPKWCILEGPSKNEWKVTSRTSNCRTCFTEGWPEFVKDHKIKITYFLTYSYDGKSTFKVKIFDATACEVKSSYFVKPSTSSSLAMCESYLHEEEDDYSDEELVDHTRRKGSKVTRHFQYVSNRRKVTAEEIGKAKASAFDFIDKCENQYWSMIDIPMKPSHVYKGFHLTIPLDWALKHMCRENHEVELRVPGVKNKWITGCRWVKPLHGCQLIKNFQTFVWDNQLEEHDICVFILDEKKNRGRKKSPLLDVHIFRVVDKPVPVTVKKV